MINVETLFGGFSFLLAGAKVLNPFPLAKAPPATTAFYWHPCVHKSSIPQVLLLQTEACQQSSACLTLSRVLPPAGSPSSPLRRTQMAADGGGQSETLSVCQTDSSSVPEAHYQAAAGAAGGSRQQRPQQPCEPPDRCMQLSVCNARPSVSSPCFSSESRQAAQSSPEASAACANVAVPYQRSRAMTVITKNCFCWSDEAVGYVGRQAWRNCIKCYYCAKKSAGLNLLFSGVLQSLISCGGGVLKKKWLQLPHCAALCRDYSEQIRKSYEAWLAGSKWRKRMLLC